MIYIDEDQVKSAADYNQWIDEIEMALLLTPDQDYQLPRRVHIDFDNNTLLLMPCITKEFLSTKIVTLFPGNINKGKPPLSGLVILNDGSSGEPIAVIDGSSLTVMRTAAAGSVGIRHLTDVGVKTLGIIGLGTQGIHQALFACSQRNFKKIFIHDKLKGHGERFRKIVSNEYPDIEIEETNDPFSVTYKSDVIITATNSTYPVIPDDQSKLEGKVFIGIGSYKPDMREFPAALFRSAGKIWVDTMHGLKESGDLIYPVENRLIKTENILPISAAIKTKQISDLPVIYKLVGVALFDLIAAKLVYNSI